MTKASKALEVIVEVLLISFLSFTSQHWIPWILKDFFPRVFTVPIAVCIFLSLLVRALELSKELDLVPKSSILLKATEPLQRVVSWTWKFLIGSSLVWILFVLGVMTWKWYLPRYLVPHMTANTSELYTALCLGMKIAGSTGMTATEVIRYTPTLKDLHEDRLSVITMIATYELQKDGVIVNTPIQKVSSGGFAQVFQTTPLGQRVCNRILELPYAERVKTPSSIQPCEETPKAQ